MYPPFTTVSSTAQERIHKSAFIHYNQTSSIYQAPKSRINTAFLSRLSPLSGLTHPRACNPDLFIFNTVTCSYRRGSWFRDGCNPVFAELFLAFVNSRTFPAKGSPMITRTATVLTLNLAYAIIASPFHPHTPRSQLYGIRNQDLLTAAKNQPIFGTGQDYIPSKQILPSPWFLSTCKHTPCKPTSWSQWYLICP